VLGTLRWQIALEARLRPLLERPAQRLAESVAIALRMGAFQLLHMDRIPAHAAIDESVELTRASGQARATGMVNAILRRLASQPKPGLPLHETTAAFAERLGHPLWLVERWVSCYGRPAAISICEAGQQNPAEAERAALFAGTEVETEAGTEALPPMGAGSRLIAELAAAAVREPRRVWDMCAAPGGKTLILAHRLPHAELLATDLHSGRLERMRRRLEQYSYAAHVRTRVADAEHPPADCDNFDLILCDAPCSGTGTLGRNPEIRHRLKPPDLARHSERQQRLVSSALERLAPGGRLVYSTCSLEPEEGEQVVEFAAAKRAASVLPMQPLLDGLSRSGVLRVPVDEAIRGDYLRTLPGVHPTDGFFAALLERA
jgi:16S rRNA (cytosine967-C5)-methyltransferase